MSDLRIVFFGTPDFAVASVKELVDGGFNIVGIVTAPDKPSGRGQKLQAPPMKIFAQSHNITCLQPTNLKDSEFLDSLKALNANLQIVVAFRMLPEAVWNMPEHGTYNVHASLLPKYRGAAPINWAIINGEKTTGVTTFKLKHEIDTGSIFLQQEVPIEAKDNASSLHDKLMEAGAKLLLETVHRIANEEVVLTPQAEQLGSPEAPKIFKEDRAIDWGISAQKVHNFVRGMSPFPSAYSTIVLEDGNEEQWKILETQMTEDASVSPGKMRVEGSRLFIACSDFWIEILTIQVPGKRKLGVDEFLRGSRLDFDALYHK